MKKQLTRVISLVFSITPLCHSLEIREAQETDSAHIAYVHYISWHATYQNIHSSTLVKQHTAQWFLEYWHKKFQDIHKIIILVAVDQDKIVGFLTAGAIHNYEWLVEKHDCEIHKLYLLPTAQKQGIGTQLFLAAVQKLRNKRLNKMLIRTVKENTQASLFYSKQGGIYITEQPCEVDNTVHEAFYSFDLNDLAR